MTTPFLNIGRTTITDEADDGEQCDDDTQQLQVDGFVEFHDIFS